MIDLRLGDCLELMPSLPDASIDAVIADIPYGTTACKWDTVIPFAPMWAQLKRIAKKNAAIVLFGSQPFTSALVMSNPQMFRYEWIWDKVNLNTRHLDAQRRPMLRHENILVFSESQTVYNRQMRQGKPYSGRGTKGRAAHYGNGNDVLRYNRANTSGQVCPATVLQIPALSAEPRGFHPTQKPVALMEYLIRTYTNEGDTVLDFTAGSGTTLVACVNTNRNGIGMEKDAGYFEIAQRRVSEAQMQTPLPLPV